MHIFILQPNFWGMYEMMNIYETVIMHPVLVITTYKGFLNPHLIKCISSSKDLLTFVRIILEWGSQRKGFLILSTTISLSLLTPNSHLIFIFIEWSLIFVSKRHNAMHYGIRAVIFRKSFQEMYNFEGWLLCLFSSNTWIFLAEGLFKPSRFPCCVLLALSWNKARGGDSIYGVVKCLSS